MCFSARCCFAVAVAGVIHILGCAQPQPLSCRAPAGPGATEGSAKACAARAHDRILSLALPRDRRSCHSALWEGVKVSKDPGCLLCCCCSGVTSCCSAGRRESSLLLEGVSSCGNCSGLSPFVLECQPQAWPQLVFASGRCDSTAWSWSPPCSKGSVLERPAHAVWSTGMCWETSLTLCGAAHCCCTCGALLLALVLHLRAECLLHQVIVRLGILM